MTDTSTKVREHCGNALRLPFENRTFDAVFMQHVAMNVEDRSALYAEVRRVLKPGRRFATYDLVLREGDVVYPAPWTRDTSASFLLSEGDTRRRLNEPDSKSSCGATIPGPRSIGSRQPWPPHRRAD